MSFQIIYKANIVLKKHHLKQIMKSLKNFKIKELKKKFDII